MEDEKLTTDPAGLELEEVANEGIEEVPGSELEEVANEGIEEVPGSELEEVANEETQGDMFPRSYVQELRQEAAGYRKTAETNATERDALANELHLALVKLDGRLADPRDLPRLDGPVDAEAIKAAISELLETRPRLAARAVAGDIGQGDRGGRGAPVDLISLMRG